MTLTVTGAVLDGETVGVRCENGRIAALGPDVVARPGEETIEAAGAPLVAPLLNGHTHAAMTLFRGSGGDLPLMPWLEEKIWPVEAKLADEDVYWGARLACAEMIRSGTTRFWDMYWHPEATARAVADAGIAATIGAPLFDHDGNAEGMRETALRSLEHLAALGPAVSPALAPHSIYTVSEESLRWIGELSAERAVPVQIHLSETEKEVADCLAAHGLRPAAYLDQLGLLGERTVLAHGVWLDHEELELVAERGCTVVTNPVANMKLAVGGVFPYPAARAAGVPVGLGTDGAGSNDSLDLLDRPEALRAGPEARRRRPDRARRRRGLGCRDRRPGAAARSRRAAPRRRPGRLPPPPPRRRRARDRRAHLQPRLRGERRGGRHHRGRRRSADARRRAARLRRDRHPRRRARAPPRPLIDRVVL